MVQDERDPRSGFPAADRGSHEYEGSHDSFRALISWRACPRSPASSRKRPGPSRARRSPPLRKSSRSCAAPQVRAGGGLEGRGLPFALAGQDWSATDRWGVARPLPVDTMSPVSRSRLGSVCKARCVIGSSSARRSSAEPSGPRWRRMARMRPARGPRSSRTGLVWISTGDWAGPATCSARIGVRNWRACGPGRA